jgi:hypothetical protein
VSPVSGFRDLEGPVNLCNRNRDLANAISRSPRKWGHRRHSGGQVSKGQPSQESMPGGIGVRRIGNSEGRKFYAFPFREVRNSDRGRTVVLWTSRSHAQELAGGAKGCRGTIVDRESGIRERVDHDSASVDFPIGRSPDKSKEHVGIFIGVRGLVRPDLVV